MEEVHWRQLSRELWLRKGDGNTAFFHRMANADHRNNSMDKIKINGVWLSEEQEVREGVANAYQQMLSENLVRSTKPSRSWEPGDSLLWGRGSFCFDGYERKQSPRPGWLHSGFWQNCWDFVKKEVMEMFKEFHEQSSFLKASIPRFWFYYQRKEGLRILRILDL